MSGSKDYLSTQEFAKKAGVSPSTVSKWLRAGKICGEKKGGKWMVSHSELTKINAPQKSTPVPSAESKSPLHSVATSPITGANQNFTVKEFSAMTYLTEFGVKKFLKEGRLISASDPSGQLLVDSASLERPEIKKLVR